MMGLPSGTVAFVFTDVEGSTRLVGKLGDEAWAGVLATHHRILREAFDSAGGVEMGVEGDGFFIVFERVSDAMEALVRAQRELEAHPWPEKARVRVRMGLHVGEAVVRGGDYVGHEVHEASRIGDVGHGGQIVVSEAAAALGRGALPAGSSLVDLGPHRLKDLGAAQRLHQLRVEGLQEAFPPLRSLESVVNNLPVQRSTLIGRDEELRRVRGLLDTHPLVTLTGVGGAGKTRVALQVGAEVLDRFPDGVFFVDLGPVSDEELVPATIVEVLGQPSDGGLGGASRPAADVVVDGLARRSCLLILDNCEHLLDGCAEIADRVMGSSPRVRLLATSREPLEVEGEHVHRVPSLATSAGVELFVARASAVAPGGEPTPDDLALVEEICRRLDGIPLAIELAAARTSHMTMTAISEHLDERFWLLAGGRRALGRHQTLQATMDWSYDLLAEDDKAVLRAASVFVGGFDAEALGAVAELSDHAVLDRLGSLVTSSLVDADRSGPHTRYRLLETVRLYAQDRLSEAGESAVRRGAHARHFLRQALAHPPRLDDVNPWRLHADEGDDLGNHLAALDWLDRQGALADLGRLAARLPSGLGYGSFTDAEQRYLGRDDVVDALEDRDERAFYLTASAANANRIGAFAEQLRLGEAAMEEATDPAMRGSAAFCVANACSIFHPERIPDLVAGALGELPQEADTLRRALLSQEPLGLTMRGRLHDAAERFEALTDEGLGFAAAELMLVLLVLGEDERALAVPLPGDVNELDAVWDYRREVVRALVAAADGPAGDAGDHLREAAAMVRPYPGMLLERDVLLGAAALAHHAGDHRRASELLATTRGQVRSPGSFVLYAHVRDLVRAHLSKQDRAAILEQAAGVDPGRALDEELERLTATRAR